MSCMESVVLGLTAFLCAYDFVECVINVHYYSVIDMSYQYIFISL